MGTRFLAAKETIVPSGYRELVLAAKHGGQATVRSKLFDNVKQAKYLARTVRWEESGHEQLHRSCTGCQHRGDTR